MLYECQLSRFGNGNFFWRGFGGFLYKSVKEDVFLIVVGIDNAKFGFAFASQFIEILIQFPRERQSKKWSIL